MIRKKLICNFFQENKLVESRWLAMFGAPSMLLEVKFYNSVNKRALQIISTPCVLHRHALASKALPEYLKITLKHVTEHVNFIRARARLFKVLNKDELIDFNVEQCLIPNSYLATVIFPNFDVDWAKSFLRCRSTQLKLLYLFKYLGYLCEAGFSVTTIKQL